MSGWPAQTQRKENIKEAYTYEEAVELTGHGSYNYLLLATSCLATNAGTIDLLAISVIATAARCDLQLTILTTGLLNSAPFIGLTLFSFAWGYYADRQGRRRALLLSTFGGFVFGALSTFSPNWQTMLALKIAGCSFSTIAPTISGTYVGEGCGSALRRRYLFFLNCSNLSAEIVYYSLAYLILPLNISVQIPWLNMTLRSWRIYNLVLAIPLGITALLLLVLYESPKLLASTGKKEEALEVLEKIYKRNGGKEKYWVKSLRVDPEDMPSSSPFWSTLVKQTKSLFKPPLLWPTLQLHYLNIVCCATNNIFLLWYPMMVNLFFNSFTTGSGDDSQSFCVRMNSNVSENVEFKDVNKVCDDTVSLNMIYAGIALGLTFTTINFAAAAVASYRKVVLITSFLVAGVCLVIVEHIREPVVIMVVYTLIQITAIGIGCCASYFVDLYPATCRGLVSCLNMMFMRLYIAIGVNLLGPLFVHHCSLTFYVWAIYIASGIVVALFLPSDKKKYK